MTGSKQLLYFYIFIVQDNGAKMWGMEAVRRRRCADRAFRRNLPMSPIYVLEAVKAKAKDILTTFFTNAWDINKPMGAMEPPILT